METQKFILNYNNRKKSVKTDFIYKIICKLCTKPSFIFFNGKLRQNGRLYYLSTKNKNSH